MSPLRPFAGSDTPDPVLPTGDIPGLRGAPVRTPVRTSGPVTGPELWPAIAGRLLTRQMWIELYGLPGYGLTLRTGKATAFAATPRDFRPCDGELGKSLLGGRLTLSGSSLDVGTPADPWNRASPNRAFATELHGFGWLPSLMIQGDRGAREAMRLTLAWWEVFARWSPFAWDPDILARRVINLSCAARKMGNVATEAERLRLADILGRQARQLLRPPGGLAGRAERLTASAIAGCVLAGRTGARLRRIALGRLGPAVAVAVGPDGVHGSRSPEAGLELLFDLMTLDDALSQLSEAVPEPLGAAIGRLTLALRDLTMPDGRLVAIQGGGPSTVVRVAAARSHDTSSESIATAPVGGYWRIQSPLLTIVTDTATPGQGPWSGTACAQPLALEIACGRDRIVTGCGWTPRAGDRQALRLTPGHSTLTLGDRSLGEPLGGWHADLLGPRLIARPLTVKVQHREADGAVWLEAEHDGWVESHGLLHERRLYLDQKLDELRAEERLYPSATTPSVGRPIAAPYAVRFQLEPGVQASLARDRRSILLRGHSGRGWWFRTDGPDVAIEPSVHVDDGLTRRTLQIVVRGSARTDAESRVRWKLSPAGASSDPH